MEKLRSGVSRDEEDLSEPFLEGTQHSTKRKALRFSMTWQAATAMAGALYFIITAPILLSWRWNRIPQPYSPAQHVLSYERKPLYFGEDERFSGLPEDVDPAWDHLLEPINIHVTKAELQQAHGNISDDIVRLKSGDYVSVLSVHHELHCLDALRRNIFPEYYYPNATEAEAEYNIVHLTHCVDTIRRSLMCHADLAIYTAYWIGDHTALPSKELRSGSDTICVNWDGVDAWARSRLLPRDKYKVLPGPFENASKSH